VRGGEGEGKEREFRGSSRILANCDRLRKLKDDQVLGLLVYRFACCSSFTLRLKRPKAHHHCVSESYLYDCMRFTRGWHSISAMHFVRQTNTTTLLASISESFSQKDAK